MKKVLTAYFSSGYRQPVICPFIVRIFMAGFCAGGIFAVVEHEFYDYSKFMLDHAGTVPV